MGGGQENAEKLNKKYKLKIEPEALADIQEIINWYNNQQKRLGQKFQEATVQQLNELSNYPHIYAIRYRKIRCALIY